MFRIIFFTAYLPLLIYVYFRCRGLFVSKKAQRVFTAFYLLFALAFPLLDYVAHQVEDSRLDLLIRLGFYTQPYLLYLFFTVILVDLGSIFFHYSRQTKKVIAISFLLPLLIVLWGAYRFTDIKTAKFQIEIPKRDSVLKSLRVVYAADFHLRGASELNALKYFVQTTNELHPDLILLPGDILEGDRHDKEVHLLEEEFQKLSSRFGTFAVLGNHESYGPALDLEVYKRSHITLLRDEGLSFPQAFTLVGRDDIRFKARKSFETLLEKIPQTLPVILMDHRPNDFAKVMKDHIDIQVSGHTHNGQIFPFNFITKKMYDLSWGYKKIGPTNFFVTSGLRGWGPQVRTTGDAELVVIDIIFK